jgi:DNA-directed RNA polymerase IV and V subunit 7
MLVTIRRNITLEPKYFDNKIKEHLLTKLKEDEGACTKDYGYIIRIIRIINIINNSISSSSSNTIFTLDFEAETIKPVEGQKMVGVVCMVFSGGIFLEIKSKLKVLVPLQTIIGYKFINNTFVKDDYEIKKGNDVSVLITSVKYSDGAFSCIARLV